MIQLRPPRYSGLSLRTRDARGDGEIGRKGVQGFYLSGIRGCQGGLDPMTRVKGMEEESQNGNQGTRVCTLPLTAEQP